MSVGAGLMKLVAMTPRLTSSPNRSRPITPKVNLLLNEEVSCEEERRFFRETYGRVEVGVEAGIGRVLGK
jgi:hypothetical protein